MSEFDDLRSQVEGDNPPAWTWEDGYILEGTVVGFTTGYTRKYGACPIVVIERRNGEKVSLFVFHAALQSRLEDANVVRGSKVVIRRLDDMKESVSGNEYYQYRVACDSSREGDPEGFQEYVSRRGLWKPEDGNDEGFADSE